MSVDARKERFELVEVFDRPMLFTCLRVDRNTVPKGLYLYEVRNDDDQCGIPVEIGRWIMVNHWGTLQWLTTGARCCLRHPSSWSRTGTITTPTAISTRKMTGTTPAIFVRPGNIWINTC